MEKVLKKYQDRLHDITRRNRSLFLGRLTMRKVFDIASLENIDLELPQKILKEFVEKGKSVHVMGTNLKRKTDEPILKSLNYLVRDLEFNQQERGVYECYVGYPFIEGSFSDGTYFRCPLILYPLKIDLNRATKKIGFRPTGQKPFLNRTFLLALNKFDSKFHGISQAELDRLAELDPDELYRKVIKLFESLNITVNKPVKLSSVKIKPVKELDSKFKKDMKHTITILPHMVAGQFSQFNSSINSDYEQIIAKKKHNELFDIFLGKKAANFPEDLVDDQSETDNFFITKPDISQELVMVQSRTAKGMVIHGPPGTGKSQVITNYIADQLARGKRILVVCEKRAALDVVYNRLSSAGLDAYSLLVHDIVHDRNDVFQKISSQLDSYGTKSSASELSAIAKEFDMSLASLSNLVEIMFTQNKFGSTMYDLYRRVDKNSKSILVLKEGFAKKFTLKKLDDLIERFSFFANDAYRITATTYPLHLRKKFTQDTQEIEIRNRLVALKQALGSLQRKFNTQEFAQDIDLIIARKPLTREWLLGFAQNLKAFDAQKDSHWRFANPWWLFVSHSLRKVIRESKLSALKERWTLITPQFQAVQKALDNLGSYFEKEFIFDIWRRIATQKSSESYVQKIIDSLGDMDVLIRYDELVKGLSSNEQQLLEMCLTTIPQEQKDMRPIWSEAIENSFALTWLHILEKKNSAIKEFSYTTYEYRSEKLQQLLSKKTKLVPGAIHTRQHEAYKMLQTAERNPLGAIIHEVTKKRKRIGLRQLVKHNFEPLASLFPVWMTSPENVSNLFSLDPDQFDVLIFDEASQTRIERALPALYRSKQLVVAGDEHQLPPTSFFMSEDDEDDYELYSYDEQQLLENESLLLRCKTIFPSRKLLYHYRSKFSELIDFSNHAFYQGELRTIPQTLASYKSPIEYMNVKGKWINQCNADEAGSIVRLVKKLLGGKKTLGIITFNVKQRDLIEDMLDMEAKRDSTFAAKLDAAKAREEADEYVGLFVKNIENVQGDERDVIIFSMGYGYDASGKFRYNFGPLNGIYGPNRLNVAISRAKEHTYVVTSIDPKDFKYTGKHRGPTLLGQYLSYAKHLSDGNSKGAQAILESLSPTPEFETKATSSFVEELADALKKEGLTVRKNVGSFGYSIDLAVVKGSKYILGIECDGSYYASSPSAKERDVYRPAVLKAFNWRVIRVFARDWWRNPKAQIRRIVLEVKSANEK